MKISLKTKLVLTIEIAVVSVAVVAGVTTFLTTRKVFEDRVYAQLQSVTDLKRGQINLFLNKIINEIEFIPQDKVMNNQLVAFLKDDSVSNKNELALSIEELKNFSENYLEFLVLDKNGEVHYATDNTDEGKIKATELYFVNGQKKTYIQDLSYDISIGSAAILIGTPIKDESGEFVGVLVGRVNVGGINSLVLERSGLGTTGESVIVNSNNLVITDLLKEPGASLKKTIYNSQINRCLTGDTFSGQFTDYHGEKVFGYYLWFPELNSCLATKVDSSEVLASIQRTYLIMIGVVLGIGLLTGFGGYLLGNVLFKPLQGLRDEVKKINEGNFDVQVIADTNDELGEVANAFNEMAKKLKISYSGLEEKVAEKTKELEYKLAELEKMNDLMVGRELTMIELKKKLQEKENG